MLNRRDFARIATLAGAAAVAIPGGATTVASPKTSTGSDLLKPPKLSTGDQVGMVLPASRAFESVEIELARQQLEALGFRVKLGRHVFDRHGYFAGTDRDRADDINRMFADDSVSGIFCYTGGWGSPRVLPLLDYDLIRRNPKVLIGYSDITALLNGIHEKTGLVTFHGPVAASKLEPWTIDNMQRVIMSSDPIGVLGNPPKKDTELVNWDYFTTTITPGTASGRIVGGNLTLVATLMGTPWEIETDGKLLFLEDIHEEPYRIDRMLTQLRLGGKLDKVTGVAFGRCTDCGVKTISFSIEEVLMDHFGALGVPVVYGFAFGHIGKKLTLPIGMPATLDATAGTVTIAEAAVR